MAASDRRIRTKEEHIEIDSPVHNTYYYSYFLQDPIITLEHKSKLYWNRSIYSRHAEKQEEIKTAFNFMMLVSRLCDDHRGRKNGQE